MSVFAKVFAMIIVVHMIMLIIQYTIAGTVSKQNPFMLIKKMMPAYFTPVIRFYDSCNIGSHKTTRR